MRHLPGQRNNINALTIVQDASDLCANYDTFIYSCNRFLPFHDEMVIFKTNSDKSDYKNVSFQ